MNRTNESFDDIAKLVQQSQPEQALSQLVDHFRRAEQFPELFEALKAKIRLNLGLPMMYQGHTEQLPDKAQQQLEEQLLEACREVGQKLLAKGHISEAWLYLSPLPDQTPVQAMLESVPVDNENINDVLEVALYQWAAPEFGYRLVLEHQGTCNGITFFDTQTVYQNSQIRDRLAELLIEHIYRELSRNVFAQVELHSHQHADASESEPKLNTLINGRSWLFENSGHHMDITHLASAVRIARFCQRKQNLQQALELCEYGLQLDQQLQYPCEAPFENNYDDHKRYFEAVLGSGVNETIKHFRDRLNGYQETEKIHATHIVLIDLLQRTDQSTAAIEQAIALRQSELESGTDQCMDLGALLEMIRTEQDSKKLMKHFRDAGDLLGFALVGVYRVTTQ